MDMTEYPETKRVELDGWFIVTEGMVKGLYHKCLPGATWRTKIATQVREAKCPNCQLDVPLEIDSLATLIVK